MQKVLKKNLKTSGMRMMLVMGGELYEKIRREWCVRFVAQLRARIKLLKTFY